MRIERAAGLKRGLVIVLSASLLLEPGCTTPTGTATQAPSLPSAASAPQAATEFNPEQLDAMLAPIALYPDELLVQMLMASTYPLQIVEAQRWLTSGSNKDLTGEALAQALAPLPWDPSVKSLVPFPQVLAQMDQHLGWTQQIGYAMATQQADVLESVQRLRRQAQSAGTLKSTEQQVVSTLSQSDAEGQPLPNETIVIQPANPQTVYVPVYDPSWAYGAWPYPAYPPVYYPPAGYYAGTGLAFLAGVAIIGSLWGWAGANWGYGGGSINVDRSRYNNITINNPNRGSFNGSNWRASSGGNRGQLRPPGGSLGGPARIQNLPANAIGRGSVQVPSSALDRANFGSAGRPGQAGQRPQAAQRPTGNAFGGMRDGSRAGQFQQRGAQSLGMQRSASGFRGGGGGFRGGGFRGGGGRRR